jgi:uncharacterized membrane protein
MLFGVGALFQKQSNDIGIGQGYYLVSFAAGILAAALIAAIFLKNYSVTQAAVYPAIAHGLLFGLGFVSLAIGLTVYQEPVSKLVPIVNMSTLVTVVLGLVVFTEHEKLNVAYLLAGALFIAIGGILVSRA